MERYFSASRSTEPQFLHSHIGPESRSFCSSTPIYRRYNHQDPCVRSVIPQCHVQIQPLRHSLRSQSQSCRPMLIHNSFSENSFEYHPNQNSVTSHQRWKNFMQHRSDKNAKNCSMDLFQDSYCHNTQMQNVRNGFSKGGPVQPPVPGMMRVVEENTGDRVISTSDEEDSYGNVSDTYPLSQETGSLAVECGSVKTFVQGSQALYSWIIKILPDKSGPCVEGKLREEDDTFWHSSLVTERLESHLVRTVSGKVYQLMGDMDLEEALFGGFDDKTCEEFACGFPLHWKDVVDQFFLRSATTNPPELTNNDIDDGDVSLIDETLIQSKEKENQEKPRLKSKDTKKKVKKAKKVVPPKPVTRARKKDKPERASSDGPERASSVRPEPASSVRPEQASPVRPKRVPSDRPERVLSVRLERAPSVQPEQTSSVPSGRGKAPSVKVKDTKKKTKKVERNLLSPAPSDSVKELCTPTGKLIQLDAVKTTRSGRAVKPVLAWYAGQSVTVDPKTNSYIVNHRTKYAESVLKDMTEFYKTRSYVSRKSAILNSSRISNTARPIVKKKEPVQEETKSSNKKKASKPKRSKEPKEPEIGLTAKRGTLKRKQQLRELVDHSNKLYQEDLFDGTPYRHHSKIPRLSDDKDEDVFSELSKKNPHMMNKMFTPMTRINLAPVSTKKTPTSGLTTDPKINRKDADRYIHKMNIHRRKLVTNKAKTSKSKEKSTIPDPHKKLFSKSDDLQNLLMQRCDSDSNHEDSGEESDYYFSKEEDN
uniref:Mis18-binding protein 1-like n=1 Tax=Crassostrea virginica TaxID=6565 RepID=A0A8B8DKI7_CRAVI|nr:mis18-binding protein 1-like [Crassostrea virginica]XP_022328685.1 mis18-binding protein 1-like [Crassostrea virginica]XP_022328686.1 mis18-binding protein 1-like [Crassostrea virginica]XP_022328687.1 mis18-binding protein 1-like [Crassostrea virginica]